VQVFRQPMFQYKKFMPVEPPDLWKTKFANPWKEMLPKKDALTLREIVEALQWGANIEDLTPDIRSALEEIHRVTTSTSSLENNI
jgi:hypothetical protein